MSRRGPTSTASTGGWTARLLDASVYIDGSLVATWRMETAWIDAYLDGEITRDELGERVAASVERYDDGAGDESVDGAEADGGHNDEESDGSDDADQTGESDDTAVDARTDEDDGESARDDRAGPG